MTLCSWVRGQLASARGTVSSLAAVPSNLEVQDILIRIGDKEKTFKGSKQWIGSVEVGTYFCTFFSMFFSLLKIDFLIIAHFQTSMVIDTLYGIPSKIIHVSSGAILDEHTQTLFEHFKTRGSPVMMGGDNDNSSKGIVGICKNDENTYLLVVVRRFFFLIEKKQCIQI